MIRLISFCIFLPLVGVCWAAPEEKLDVRFLAEMIPKNLGQVLLANAELRSDPFNLPMNNLSPPQKPPARVFNIWSLEINRSIASVKLPEEGKSFIVLLLLSQKGDYSPVVLPAENPAFKGGDVYFFNNTKKLVLGKLGKTDFSLQPGKSTVVTPRGFGDARYYHALLGVRKAGKNSVIKSMKWPSSKLTRNYVFFFFDPLKKRITYRAVDEFIIPKQKKEK